MTSSVSKANGFRVGRPVGSWINGHHVALTKGPARPNGERDGRPPLFLYFGVLTFTLRTSLNNALVRVSKSRNG